MRPKGAFCEHGVSAVAQRKQAKRACILYLPWCFNSKDKTF